MQRRLHLVLKFNTNLTIFRLIYKLFNPTPPLGNSVFIGQRVIAKLNHILLVLPPMIQLKIIKK